MAYWIFRKSVNFVSAQCPQSLQACCLPPAILVAALVMLTCIGSLGAQSQPPVPTPTESSQPPQAEPPRADQPTADGGPEGEAGTTVIEPAQTPNAAAKAAQKHEKREAESATDWFTGAVALFTGLLVICTGIWIWIAHRQNQIMRTIERAYVTMSHHSESGNPSLKIDPTEGTATVAIKVRNYGRTPAEVTDVFLALAFDALPPPHSYVLPPGHQQTRAFLVTQSEFNYHRTFGGLDPNDLMAVMEEVEERKLWLYGYVDYRDSFGTRHRGGYMRQYCRFDHSVPPQVPGVPVESENNLIFDPTPKFNYDRRRRRGEGNDWDEGE